MTPEATPSGPQSPEVPEKKRPATFRGVGRSDRVGIRSFSSAAAAKSNPHTKFTVANPIESRHISIRNLHKLQVISHPEIRAKSDNGGGGIMT